MSSQPPQFLKIIQKSKTDAPSFDQGVWEAIKTHIIASINKTANSDLSVEIIIGILGPSSNVRVTVQETNTFLVDRVGGKSPGHQQSVSPSQFEDPTFQERIKTNCEQIKEKVKQLMTTSNPHDGHIEFTFIIKRGTYMAHRSRTNYKTGNRLLPK